MPTSLSVLTTSISHAGRHVESRITEADSSKGKAAVAKAATKADDAALEVTISPEGLRGFREAVAAEQRELTRHELKQENKRILYQLNFDVATADAEVANMDRADPERVKSAEQAMVFRHGGGENPFAGLPRAELTAIMYDESGKYTLHERWAALFEQQKQDFEHFSALAGMAVATGDWRHYYQATLDFYHSLTPLERSRDEYVGFEETITRFLKEEETEHGKLMERGAILSSLLHYLGKKDEAPFSLFAYLAELTGSSKA